MTNTATKHAMLIRRAILAVDPGAPTRAVVRETLVALRAIVGEPGDPLYDLVDNAVDAIDLVIVEEVADAMRCAIEDRNDEETW